MGGVSHEDNTLYFITDTQEIYKGNKKFSDSTKGFKLLQVDYNYENPSCVLEEFGCYYTTNVGYIKVPILNDKIVFVGEGSRIFFSKRGNNGNEQLDENPALTIIDNNTVTSFCIWASGVRKYSLSDVADGVLALNRQRNITYVYADSQTKYVLNPPSYFTMPEGYLKLKWGWGLTDTTSLQIVGGSAGIPAEEVVIALPLSDGTLSEIVVGSGSILRTNGSDSSEIVAYTGSGVFKVKNYDPSMGLQEGWRPLSDESKLTWETI